MTTPDGTDIFYGAIPVFRGFDQPDGPGAVYAVAGRLDRRRRRHRGIDQGDRQPALQGGQHGRRCRDRRRHQCAGWTRISVRVRRRWRELCGGARRSRPRARGAGGDRDLGQGRPRSRDAGGAGAGQGRARAGPRCSRRAFRAVAQSVLCDVFRRRARLGGCRDEARRVRRAAGAARRAAGSVRPVVPVRGNSRPRAVSSCRCWWCRPRAPIRSPSAR